MCMLACLPQHTCSRLARHPARRRSGQIDFIEFLDMFSQQLLELQQLEQFLHMDAAPSDWPKRDGKLVEVCLALLQASSCHFASWLWLMLLSDSSRHKGQHGPWRWQAAPRHSYARLHTCRLAEDSSSFGTPCLPQSNCSGCSCLACVWPASMQQESCPLLAEVTACSYHAQLQQPPQHPPQVLCTTISIFECCMLHKKGADSGGACSPRRGL